MMDQAPPQPGSGSAVLERVRKLLAKAEDPACPPAEAAALNDKAAELIAKYGVDRALLAAGSPEVDPVADRVIRLDPPYALDKAGLLAAIASALRCHSVRRKQWDRGTYVYSIHLFGCESDLERTELLFTSLLVQASYGLAAAQVPPWESVAAFRRSWLAGFTRAVEQRLWAAERRASSAAESGEASMALVLADRDDRVARRVAEVYPRLGKAAPRRLVGTGGRAGYAAGQRADLGGRRVGRPAPRVLPPTG